ncbi:MAG: GNAT family N-acetyltransferase [Verrucomicrobiales bacterium]
MTRRLHIQPLDPARHDRAGFDCGVAELNRYLTEQARKEVAAGAATCFVATWKETASEIVGFYTLSAAVIHRSKLPEKWAKKLPCYPELPATLLGRLAVAGSEKGTGIGRKLVLSAMSRTANAADEIGAIAMVSDPKDDGALRFYEKFGFEALDERRLYLSMQSVKVLLNAR